MKNKSHIIIFSTVLLIVAIIFIALGSYMKYKYERFLLPPDHPPVMNPPAFPPTSTPPIIVPTPKATSTPVTTIDSGIKGKVTIGPTCPVMREPPDPGCNDKPYSTSFKLLKQSGQFVKTFTSDQNGNFIVIVVPGEYKIEEASPKTMPRMGTVENIKVSSHQYTKVDISFDSGIR